MKAIISEEIALQELSKVLGKFLKKEVDSTFIKEKYPKSLNAVMSGNLSFADDDKFTPTYKLIYPIVSESGAVDVDMLTLKTRIKPTVKADLAEGLDLSKSAAKFSLRLIAHVCGFSSVNYLDKLEVEDYDLIEELSPVFM